MRKAICCIAKNEDLYIDEWVQYHWKLGFDDIYVFLNDWRYQGHLAEGNKTRDKRLYLMEMDGKVKQLDAYNTFIELYSRAYDWAAFIDVDEFFCLRSFNSLGSILATMADAFSLCVNWRLFGDSGLSGQPIEDYSLLKRFTHCDRHLNLHVKQIVNLKLCRQMGVQYKMVNPHFGIFPATSLEFLSVAGPFNKYMLEYIHDIELNHYFLKTREEFSLKIARGRADTPGKRRNEDKLFSEHNHNEVVNTAAKEFMYG